jgi:hypothetical protein
MELNQKAFEFEGCQTQSPPCTNNPPPEDFIIYDETSSPSADDYRIDAGYPIDTYL